MKGLPLGVLETTNGFSKRSTGRDESTTLYHPYVIIRSVIAQKRTIDPKVGRIVTKVSREKSISQPKIKKTPQNFVPFLTAKVCFRSATTAKLSDNVRLTAGQHVLLTGRAAMLYCLCIAGS